MLRPKINTVFSTCIRRDSEIWKVASPLIIDHIDATRYVVIVPWEDVELFSSISPSRYEVWCEDKLLDQVNVELIRKVLPESKSMRAGWYFQQIIKIAAILTLEDEQIGLIWDGDTIPLKRMKFFDGHKLIYRTGVHTPKIHEPYFTSIEKLLGLKRGHDHSFISQCFPANREWIIDMCCLIEQRLGIPWWKGVLKSAQESDSFSGFSEYETMGTYISHHYSEFMSIEGGRYYRPANFLCKLEVSSIMQFSRYFDYLAFDAYESKQCTGLNVGCGYTRMTKTFDGNECLNIDITSNSSADMIMDVTETMPFDNGKFNHIIAHNVLEHVSNPLSVLSEFDRILMPGGILQIEVPHLGSYNHGTDITHKFGFTFDTFNFMLYEGSYLYPTGGGGFRYRLIRFNREVLDDGMLKREYLTTIPLRGTYQEWLRKVYDFQIPGTFGFIFQKIP